jgi:hypothetical protein
MENTASSKSSTMIKTVESQLDIELFAHAGVAFSKKYPNGIPHFLTSERHLFEPKFNYFLRIGGFLEAFLFLENGKTLGRVAAMIHPEHPERGLVGLFDCENESRVANALLDAAKNCLQSHQCTSLIGPVNFSIFQSYRFMTKGFDQETFVGEPRNPDYYPQLFKAYGFAENHRWVSWELSQHEMDKYLENNRIHYETFHQLGYCFKKFELRNASNLMKQTFKLLIESYRVFPFFTNISEDDFLQEYNLMPTIIDPDCSTFGYTPGHELYGFNIIVKDLTKALRSMNGKTDLLAKFRFLLNSRKSQMANFAQGGSLPRFIREGLIASSRMGDPHFSLSAATVYRTIHAIRKSKKYNSVIFTLMREDGMINLQIKDLHCNERAYAVYEYPLTQQPHA